MPNARRRQMLPLRRVEERRARRLSPRPMRIVSCDIGGTHARFSVATVAGDGRIDLGEPVTLKTADYPGFAEAFEAFASGSGADSGDLAIAFAGPVSGPKLKLTNSAWTINRDELERRFDRLTIVNDFGAVAHAVGALGKADFAHLCGPDVPLPLDGVVSIVGPGTGLGVAMLLRESGRSARVIETEGGHIAFAPTDEVEGNIADTLRERFGRVSVERLVSGSGLTAIYSALSEQDAGDARPLWASALDGSDPRAVEALDRFCRILGSVAGDLALAQGAGAVVIAGGLGRRLIGRLPSSGFAERFAAKGRFRDYMERVPVKLVTHPEPGLLGAAAAFAQEHC